MAEVNGRPVGSGAAAAAMNDKKKTGEESGLQMIGIENVEPVSPFRLPFFPLFFCLSSCKCGVSCWTSMYASPCFCDPFDCFWSFCSAGRFPATHWSDLPGSNGLMVACWSVTRAR